MRHVEGLENLDPAPERSVVTIGKFLALHRGHQALIRETRARATARAAACVALTFDRHPVEVLRPGTQVPLVVPWPERLALLEALGVDLVVVARVTPEFLRTPPEAFARDVLRERLRAVEVVASGDFRFGRGAGGTLATLRRLGGRCGFAVREVPPVQWRGAPVSTSRVVAALEAGDVADAAEMLGRPYALRARVVRGDGRGRELGFPTANLEPLLPQLLPRDGVYTARVEWDRQDRPAVANLGVRPTVDGSRRVLEAHLLDFDGELYGRELTLRFRRRLRDEQRFPSLAALREQIARDAAAAREEGEYERRGEGENG